MVAVPVSDVDVSVPIHGESTRMWLNRKRAEKLSLGGKLLHSLITELGGVHHVVLTDCDAHTGGEFALPLAVASPFQQEPGRCQAFVTLRAPDSRPQSEIPQGQRTLKRFSEKHLHQKVVVPAAAAAFHGEAPRAQMLLQK